MTPYNHAVFKKTSKKSVVSSSEIITIFLSRPEILYLLVYKGVFLSSPFKAFQGGGVTGA
jgi:hypothetical protein